MDMISACIIIYKIYMIYVQQLCYVEGQQCCCQEAVGGTRLERGRVDWREGQGAKEGMPHSTNQYHSRLVHRIMFEPIV